jgi:hypothetical protein
VLRPIGLAVPAGLTGRFKLGGTERQPAAAKRIKQPDRESEQGDEEN